MRLVLRASNEGPKNRWRLKWAALSPALAATKTNVHRTGDEHTRPLSQKTARKSISQLPLNPILPPIGPAPSNQIQFSEPTTFASTMLALSFVCLLVGMAAAAANDHITPSYVSWSGLYMHWRTDVMAYRLDLARRSYRGAPIPPTTHHTQNDFEAVPPVHISTDAFAHANRLTHGRQFALIVTIDRAAVSNHNVTAAGRHLFNNRNRVHARNRRQPRGANHHNNKALLPTPVNTADFKLLVTAPAGFVHRVTHADPKLEPEFLLTPEPQGGNALLWARVPIPQYQDVRAVQAFRIAYTVTAEAAVGTQEFTASVWQGDTKLHESTQDVSFDGVYDVNGATGLMPSIDEGTD